METISEMMPLAVPQLTSCPPPMVAAELRAAWRRFCTDTEAWRARIEVDLDPARDTFILYLPEDTLLLRVRDVQLRYGAAGAWSRPADDAYELGGDWSTPALIFEHDLPSDGTLRADVAVGPLPELEDPPCDAELLTRFGDGIAAGAVARLAAMAGRSWSSAALAEMGLAEYRKAVHRAKAEQPGVRGRRAGMAALFGRQRTMAGELYSM